MPFSFLQTSSLVQYQSPAYVSGFRMLSKGGIDATSDCNRWVERERYTHFSCCELKNGILTVPTFQFQTDLEAQKREIEEPVFELKPLSSWRKLGEEHGRQYRNPIWGRADEYLKYFERASWDNFQFLPCLLSIHWKAGYEEKQVTNAISTSSDDFYMLEQGRKYSAPGSPTHQSQSAP